MAPQPVGQVTTTTAGESITGGESAYVSPLDDAITAQGANEPATTEEAQGRYADSKREIQAIRTQKQATVVGGMDPSVGVRPTVSPSVSEVYRATQGFNPGLIRGLREADIGRKPTYFDKDWAEIMGDWSIDKIKFFQDQAVRGGMINPEDSSYKYGQRDYITVQAFGQLLTDANNNGNFWEDQLDVNIAAHQEWLRDNPEEEEKYPSFVTPVYLAPDYATLAQETKNTFNAKLGRRATKAELSLFTDHLRGTDEQEWAANTQGLRQEHAARAREFESEEPESAGTVQGVDSISRFNEFFDEKYQGEIAHRERVDQVQRKQGGLFTSLNRIAGNI